MLGCANLLVLPLTFTFLSCALAAAENDTVVVGSYVHETKVRPPVDSVSAASKKNHHNEDDGLNYFHKDLGDEGFKRSHSTKDKDGYNKFDTFHTKDGDGFGYEQHSAFGKKGAGGKHGGYHEATDFNDEDEAAGSVSPKFSEWHFEKDSGSPAKSYRFESDTGGKSKGKLVGPDYEGYGGSKRSKRKKDNVQPAATEYDNYEYADVEEADDAPADFDAEEGADPEYGNIEADAYDYY